MAAAAAAAGEGLQATDLRGLLVPPPEAAADEFFYRLLVMRFLRPREMACLGAASKLSLQSMEVMAERILEAVLPVCYHSMAMPALVPVKPEGRLSFFVPAVYQATKKQVMLTSNMSGKFFGLMIFESDAEGEDVVRFEERTETLRDESTTGYDDSCPCTSVMIEFQGKIYAIAGTKKSIIRRSSRIQQANDSIDNRSRSSTHIFCWEKQETEGGAPTWSWVRQLVGLTAARQCHCACVHDDKLYVAGGWRWAQNDSKRHVNSVDVFDGTEWQQEEHSLFRAYELVDLFSLPSGMHAIWTTDEDPEDDPDLEDEERWPQIQRRDDETGEWEHVAYLHDDNEDTLSTIVASFLLGTRIYYIYTRDYTKSWWDYYDTASEDFGHDRLDAEQRLMPESHRLNSWRAKVISTVSFQEAMQALAA